MLLALVLGYSPQSHAGLLIEPVIGYSFGNANIDVEVPSSPTSNSSDKNSVKGTSYGGRLGYQNFGFQLGVDYLASAMETDGDKFNTSEFGGFVGFEFPILVRVYAGYVFSGTGTLAADDGDLDFKNGTGPKVGIGFTLLPFLDINLEYRSITYEELETTFSGTPTNLNADYNAVMLGFSLPFVL
jgi:hypothetical protein